jgi:hypothetical protein
LQLAGICSTASAQISVSGIVNTYTPVTSIVSEGCNTFLQVEDTVGFYSGDRVLIIQTKGCSDSSAYAVDGVGVFELATIERLAPNNNIVLDHALLYSYTICGAVQLVRVSYTEGTCIVQDTVRPVPWNGRIGGVLCLQVKGTLVLNAPLDVSGTGYPGGALWNGGGQCSTITSNTTVNHPDASCKGTSFVTPHPTDIAGGAALFSGGGGGLGHNSGGGGGGNSGYGGNGGAQWRGCGARFDNGGRGGNGFVTQLNGMPRLRFGGGGGAGHMNNQRGTAGGAGGGIVVLIADSIVSNNQIIEASGFDALTAGNDGAGGGGGGGCAVVDCYAFTGSLVINAHGGRGGDVSDGDLHGPGGGGGGGYIFFASTVLPDSIQCYTQGGSQGRCTRYTDTAVSYHLAQPGTSGQIQYSMSVPRNLAPKNPVDVSILGDTLVCEGASLSFSLYLLDAVAEVEWFEIGRGILGRSSTLTITPKVTTRYSVTVRDSAGCTARDTITVHISSGRDVELRSLDIGTVYCSRIIDTSIVVVNTGNATARISTLTSTGMRVIVLDTMPIFVAASDSVRVRVRVRSSLDTGINTADLRAVVAPCDSVRFGSIAWRYSQRVHSVVPNALTMASVFSCSQVAIDTSIQVVIYGSSGTITQVVGQGTATSGARVPMQIQEDVPFQLPVRWTPTRSMTSGRVGLVFASDNCTDTVWVTVDGKAQLPQMQPPDTVRITDILRCKSEGVTVDFRCSSGDSTTWRITAISAPPEVTINRQVGDTAVGAMLFQARVVPGQRGPFAHAVDITFSPCDTTIRVMITGNVIDAVVEHSDTIVINEPVIGRTTFNVATYLNTGNTPVTVTGIESSMTKPFRIVATVPTLPTTLNPGDSLEFFVTLTQEYGRHTDSLVILTSHPCAPRERIVYFTEARATTRLVMPNLYLAPGSNGSVPILMEGRPSMERRLLDSFSLDVSVQSRDLYIRSGSNAFASWKCAENNGTTVVSIAGKWTGTDTIATLPVQALLSHADITPLHFEQTPGFLWTSSPCNILYRDGTVRISSVCFGKDLRMIELAPTATFIVTPNPTPGTITITPQPPTSDTYTLSVVNVLGNVVATSSGTGAQSFTLDTLLSGVYIVHIECHGNVYSTLIVKQ